MQKAGQIIRNHAQHLAALALSSVYWPAWGWPPQRRRVAHLGARLGPGTPGPTTVVVPVGGPGRIGQPVLAAIGAKS